MNYNLDKILIFFLSILRRLWLSFKWSSNDYAILYNSSFFYLSSFCRSFIIFSQHYSLNYNYFCSFWLKFTFIFIFGFPIISKLNTLFYILKYFRAFAFSSSSFIFCIIISVSYASIKSNIFLLSDNVFSSIPILS